MTDKGEINKISAICLLRIKRLISCLNRKNLDNYIVLKDENIFYLTGFYGKDSNSIFIISAEKSYLLVNFIYLEEAKKAITDPKIEIILYKKNRFKKLVEILKGLNSGSAGIEAAQVDHVSYVKLENMLRKTGNKLTYKHGLVEDLRIVKDGSEIKDIKKACKITDNIFQNFLGSTSGDMSKLNELEIAIELEKMLIQKGGNGRSFDFVIASGPGSSMPHYISSHKKLKNGILLMDFGTVYKNYCSDITRTVFIGNGSPNDKLIKIYDIVLKAQQKAIEACKEGLTCGELDNKARKYINDMGYGEEFGHGLGHGVGLEVHEGPTVTKNNKTILKENMVITIEPGIYIPGLGGIRIEDMLVVKKNGCENLYNSKKEFTILP
jgi:Xaa-Pro aminopeptidase